MRFNRGIVLLRVYLIRLTRIKHAIIQGCPYGQPFFIGLIQAIIFCSLRMEKHAEDIRDQK